MEPIDQTTTPHILSERLLSKAEEFSRYSGEFAQHIKLQADYFNTFRDNYKSDNATQKAFDATPDGVRMAVLKLKLRALTAEMSALKTHMRHLDTSAHNLY